MTDSWSPERGTDGKRRRSAWDVKPYRGGEITLQEALRML